MNEPFGDWSYQQRHFQEATWLVANQWSRPSVLFKPRLFVDGNAYCALYGDDLQSGCTGFGATAAEAMEDFDQNWLKTIAPERATKCGQCGEVMAFNANPDGCRDPNCPMIE